MTWDGNEPHPDFSDVQGGGSSSAPRPPAEKEPAVRTHTVVKGDSLSRIAKHYYGQASRWKALYDANKAVVGPNRSDQTRPGAGHTRTRRDVLMLLHPRIRLAGVIALSGLVAVSACKGKEPPAPPPVVEPVAPPAPVAVASIVLGRAIGSDMMVTTPTAEFGVRDTIYASVATTGVAQSATLMAHWTFGDGQLVDSTSVPIAPTGPAVTEFHIIRNSAWPKGRYKVAIALNGAAAGEREFEVK